METEHIIVLCTVPDKSLATDLAGFLIEEKLAACVNIVSNVTSVYRWQGKTTSDNENLMIIKTTAVTFSKLQQAILERHPYELPEIIAVPITSGLPAYLDWVSQQTSATE